MKKKESEIAAFIQQLNMASSRSAEDIAIAIYPEIQSPRNWVQSIRRWLIIQKVSDELDEMCLQDGLCRWPKVSADGSTTWMYRAD